MQMIDSALVHSLSLPSATPPKTLGSVASIGDRHASLSVHRPPYSASPLFLGALAWPLMRAGFEGAETVNHFSVGAKVRKNFGAIIGRQIRRAPPASQTAQVPQRPQPRKSTGRRGGPFPKIPFTFALGIVPPFTRFQHVRRSLQRMRIDPTEEAASASPGAPCKLPNCQGHRADSQKAEVPVLEAPEGRAWGPQPDPSLGLLR
jgi:hypothetical protein